MTRLFSINFLFLIFTFQFALLYANDKTSEGELAFTLDATLYEKELSKDQIKLIIDQFDTYDYVRTKNQREVVINYLLKQSEKQNYTEGIGRCKNILGVLCRDRSESVI